MADLNDYDPDLIEFVRNELRERFEYYFFYGDEKYREKYPGEEVPGFKFD